MQPIHFLAAGCSELPHRDGSSSDVHSSAFISKSTETAPNSSTGSGQRVFPHGDGFLSLPLSQGVLENRRPRNLSVPHAGQANRRAQSSKGNDGLPGAFPRNRDLDGTRGRQSQRIGSVRKRLCRWAASAGSCERKPAVTGTAANPNVRGRAFAAGESCGIDVPDIDSRAMRSLLAPQSGRQLAAPGRGWFNWCCTWFSL